MLKNILLNKWFFTFVTGWVVFFLLIDWKTIYKNMWSGILCIIMELWQDGVANKIGMYYIQETGITIFNVSAFFTFGLTVTMGILYMQFIPKKPVLQIIHMIIFTVGFTVFEHIVTSAELLTKLHWNLTASLVNNVIIFGSILWLNQFVEYKLSENR